MSDPKVAPAVRGPRHEEDLAFMRSPSKWPRWPLLPLTQRRGSLGDKEHCAFMFADGEPAIYIGVIYLISAKPGTPWSEVLKPFERRKYETFELLADDYTVD
jgi:hypothetical protein